jgi:hypothetical protein
MTDYASATDHHYAASCGELTATTLKGMKASWGDKEANHISRANNNQL